MINSELYNQILQKLWDIQSFEFVTPMENICGTDLDILANGNLIKKPIKVYKHAREQECHAITALAWLKNKNLKVHAGVGYSDLLDGWYYHSFSTNSRGHIIEPTPLVRDLYFGTQLNPKQTQKMINDEIPNLIRLGFDIKSVSVPSPENISM